MSVRRRVRTIAGGRRPTKQGPRRHTGTPDGGQGANADNTRPIGRLDRNHRDMVMRLRRIEGQARGIQGMVIAGRDHVELVTQMRSMEEAVRSTIREVLYDQLESCAAAPSTRVAQEMLGELIELMRRFDP